MSLRSSAAEITPVIRSLQTLSSFDQDIARLRKLLQKAERQYRALSRMSGAADEVASLYERCENDLKNRDFRYRERAFTEQQAASHAASQPVSDATSEAIASAAQVRTQAADAGTWFEDESLGAWTHYRTDRPWYPLQPAPGSALAWMFPLMAGFPFWWQGLGALGAAGQQKYQIRPLAMLPRTILAQFTR